MKILSKEKIKVLADKNGWSLAKAEGYIDGETFRRRGKLPSIYAKIGIDEYSLGFRTGYYERQNTSLVAAFSRLQVAHLGLRPSEESAEVVAATATP
jgi:hypothetical protein